MKITQTIYLLLCLPFICLTFTACQTTKGEIDTNLTAAEIFQKAQEISESGNFNLALQYYQAFQEQYPDEADNNIWASYEIAFLYYKMGDIEKSVELFHELLKLYENSPANLPQGPRILTEKLLITLENNDTGQNIEV